MPTPFPIVFKGAQFGLQSSFGSGVAADLRLLTPGFSRVMPKSSGAYMFTAPGNRLPTASVPPGMHNSEVAFEGPMTYTDMIYILANGLGLDTPAADGTNGWIWEFSLGLTSEVARQLLTYENGNSERAERAINVFTNSYQFNMSKATQSFSGTMIGGKKERAATITPTPTEVSSRIIAPQDFDFYVADTKGALDTAVSTDDKFPIPLSVQLTIPDMAGILGRMNSDEDSYFAVIAKAVTPTLVVKTTDDTDMDDLVAILDTSATKFFAARALGDVIAGAVTSQEEARFDFAGRLIEPESTDEEEGAATGSLTFQNVYDSTWGQSLNIKVVNALATL
jgi:hypothetical protein